MTLPTLTALAPPPERPDQTAYQIVSPSGSALLDLLETREGLSVELLQIDGNVHVRVPRDRLADQRRIKHRGTLLGTFEDAYVGALVRRAGAPDATTRPVGAEGDACVHEVRLHEGRVELLLLDPALWVPAQEWLVVRGPQLGPGYDRGHSPGYHTPTAPIPSRGEQQ